MIGIHSISVIADAITKGLVDDKYKGILYNAVMATSKMSDYRGIGLMNSQNHLTIQDESESVSKTLEYCYQYYCMSQICKWAGKDEAAKNFEWVSLGYKNLFNADAGFFEPRLNGGWLPNFEPTQVNNNYTEANGWQYSFFVPHDINGMVELYGGKEKFHAKLDSLFGTNSNITGREQPDITGLIGQYAHGNEPSHHVAYLYNYVGDFRSTSNIVSKISNEFYTNQVDGLSGNEDCGQMSAWYVLSALGLYQVNPGSPYYTLTVPQVTSAKIHLENGNTISIKKDVGEINRIRWNGVRLDKLYLAYEELMKGGELSFESSGTNEITEGDILFSSMVKSSSDYFSAPVIVATEPIFKKSTMIVIKTTGPSLPIFYQVKEDENISSVASGYKRYSKPFKIKKNATVIACAYNDVTKQKSPVAFCSVHKRPNNFTIDIKSVPNVQYFAGGAQGLLDGVKGEVDWRKGNWHGYQGQDFEALIDTKKKKKHNQIVVTFLADNKSWIYYPIQLELYASNDNKNFELIKSIDKSLLLPIIPTLDVQGISELILNISDQPAFRYYKIKAINSGPLPKGHPGEGSPSFIFVDEIEFK